MSCLGLKRAAQLTAPVVCLFLLASGCEGTEDPVDSDGIDTQEEHADADSEQLNDEEPDASLEPDTSEQAEHGDGPVESDRQISTVSVDCTWETIKDDWWSPVFSLYYREGHVFAGGDGSVLHFDGAQWTESIGISPRTYAAAEPGGSLFGGWSLSRTVEGTMWSFGAAAQHNATTNTWSWDPAFPTSECAVGRYIASGWQLTDIACPPGYPAVAISDTQMIAAKSEGNDGTLFQRDGNSWVDAGVGSLAPIKGIWGSSAIDIWAAGSSNTLLHFDGGTWNTRRGQPSGLAARKDYVAVSGTGPADVMFLMIDGSTENSYRGYLARWSGGGWERISRQSNPFVGGYPSALWRGSDGRTLVGDERGRIFQSVQCSPP